MKFLWKNNYSRVLGTNSSVYRQLDVWRSVAAIWVVMDHSCSTVITDKNVFHDSASLLSTNYLYAFSISGQLGVIMFFIISGYCIVLAANNAISKKRSGVDFLRARLKRIYPPYYASIVLTVLLALGFNFIAHLGLIPPINHKEEFLNNTFEYYFANLTLTQVPLNVKCLQVVYWSLCYEVAFYFIVTMFIFLNRKFKFSLYSMIFILTQLSLLWLIISPTTCLFPLDLWYLFGLGAFVYMLIEHPTDLHLKILMGITASLVIIFAYFQKGLYSLGIPSSRAQAIVGLTFTALLLFMYRFDGVLMNNRVVKMLAFLGNFSYSIYLSHNIIISIPRQLMIKMGFIEDRYWVTFLVEIIVAIGFGYLFHIICERPFMSLQARTRESNTKVKYSLSR